MRNFPGLVVVLVLVACGGGGDDDGGPDAAATVAEQCEAERTAWRALIDSASKSCVDDVDCTTTGGIEDCSCRASLAERCEGAPINADARNQIAPQLAPHAARWHDLQCASVDELGRTCDCAPEESICDRGTCVLSFTRSCFPIDTGVL